MKRLGLAALLLTTVCSSTSAQSISAQAVESDPWWAESNISMPTLISEGWVVAFFNSSDDGLIRHYLLKHPQEEGLWTCIWQQIFTDEIFYKAACSYLREG